MFCSCFIQFGSRRKGKKKKKISYKLYALHQPDTFPRVAGRGQTEGVEREEEP